MGRRRIAFTLINFTTQTFVIPASGFQGLLGMADMDLSAMLRRLEARNTAHPEWQIRMTGLL